MALFLVTGAAGFIGSSLVRALMERGTAVRGFDDLSTGKRENLAEVLPKMELQVGSILDEAALKTACRGTDAILHLAGLPYFVARGENAFASHAVNVKGTMNLLEAAREAGVKRFVFASSATVYGDNPATPKTEELTPEPNSPYSVQKLCCEHYVKCFHRMYGMETIALRYFNVYGPRQDPGSPLSGVVSRFANQILQGQEITLQGDGEQTRDFNFVGNTVE